jgi:hypothetical protein
MLHVGFGLEGCRIEVYLDFSCGQFCLFMCILLVYVRSPYVIFYKIYYLSKKKYYFVRDSGLFTSTTLFQPFFPFRVLSSKGDRFLIQSLLRMNALIVVLNQGSRESFAKWI